MLYQHFGLFHYFITLPHPIVINSLIPRPPNYPKLYMPNHHTFLNFSLFDHVWPTHQVHNHNEWNNEIRIHPRQHLLHTLSTTLQCKTGIQSIRRVQENATTFEGVELIQISPNTCLFKLFKLPFNTNNSSIIIDVDLTKKSPPSFDLQSHKLYIITPLKLPIVTKRLSINSHSHTKGVLLQRILRYLFLCHSPTTSLP